MEKFNVISTPLQDSNLIEASAGTGKTHSIALLAMRLIVEKKLEIQQILMVTFTNAAVAELEQRIRVFVKDAYNYTSTENADSLPDDLIEILDRAIDMHGKETILKDLYQSQLFLDETAIFTIHGFCQRTLTEFAFETGQPFESKLVTDTNALVDEAVNKFWREKITTLNVDLLGEVTKYDFDITKLKNFVKSGIIEDRVKANEKQDENEVIENIRKIGEEIKQSYQEIIDYYDSNEKSITAAALGLSKGSVLHKNAGNRDNFLNVYETTFFKKSPPGYVLSFSEKLEKLFTSYREKRPMLSDYVFDYNTYLNNESLNYAKQYIDNKKQKLGLLFYDDLIKNLHKAVDGPNKDSLIEVLNEKYKAVFIDEFHDTDKYQYEIFNNLFGGNSIIFLIGDPKQSIYGWRGADLETYKFARSQVDHQFDMEKNYRSTEKYISAINAIYKSVDNPFYDESITYSEVRPGRNVGKLSFEGKEVKPITIIEDQKVDDAYIQVALQINNVLTGDFAISKNGKNQKVLPSDLAIIVRKNEQASEIKKQLVKLGIPAVAYDKAQVLQSKESQDVFYILAAILKQDKSNINRALASRMTGMSNNDLIKLDDDSELENFRMFSETLINNGVYGALMQFAAVYRLRKNSLKRENGERIVSNFLQISELLQKQEIEKGQSPEQLLNWLQRVLEGEKTEGDEYAQRIESDEQAVTLITIHKSKGLAFNIVFAPFLNMKPKDVLIDGETNLPIEESIEEQENRRLMYVALTRAVYKSYINITSSSRGIGTIHHFEAGIKGIGNDLVETIEREEEPEKEYVAKEESIPGKPRVFSAKIDRSWRILSFSGLSQSHSSVTREEKEYDAPAYDDFVFNRLPKGIVAGLFLHEIFENIDFTKHENWENEIVRVGNKYSITISESDKVFYLQLIDNVLKANYEGNSDKFTLDKLTSDHKIHELEFYFSLNKFKTGELKSLLSNIGIDHNSFNGAMHGFVDLFFEMNGRYYILDWKSNYLGNVIEAYTPEKLDDAMTASNYHLQYLIYTVAVKRFLQKKVPDFDYEKHFGGVFYTFLRGMREEKGDGIFYHKPDANKIDMVDKIFSL